MARMPSLAAAACAVLLSGCMTAAAYVNDRLETFVPAHYAWAMTAGPNTVSGRALSDPATGEPGVCTGTVTLLPDGPYVRFHNSVNSDPYVGDDLGDRGLEWRDAFLPPEAQYLIRRVPCDGAGRFEFRGLPNGTYILFAPLPRAQRYVRKRLTVRDGRRLDLQLVHTCVKLPRPKWKDFVSVCGVAPVHPRVPPTDPNF